MVAVEESPGDAWGVGVGLGEGLIVAVGVGLGEGLIVGVGVEPAVASASEPASDGGQLLGRAADSFFDGDHKRAKNPTPTKSRHPTPTTHGHDPPRSVRPRYGHLLPHPARLGNPLMAARPPNDGGRASPDRHGANGAKRDIETRGRPTAGPSFTRCADSLRSPCPPCLRPCRRRACQIGRAHV